MNPAVAPFDPALLEPLDILLYFTPCLADFVIAIKTYSLIGHVEISWTKTTSVAARSAGVKEYPFRSEGLKRVLRSNLPPDYALAKTWFEKNADGKAYNFFGLCSFEWPGDKQLPLWQKWEKDRWFCSELATDILRAAGTHPFSDLYPSIKVPPALFLASPNLREIWTSEPAKQP